MGLMKRPKNTQFDLIEIHECKDIIRQYDIGDIIRIESLIVSEDNIVNLLERSDTSRKFSIVTDKGRFFLKQVPWYCNFPEQIEYSAGLINYLHKSAMPVPKVYQTRNGGMFSETRAGRYTISELRTGALYDCSNAEIKSSAEFLANMHKLTRTWDQKLTGEKNSPEKVFFEHVELAKKIATERHESSQIINEISRVFCRHVSTPDNELFAVHGDFIPWNIGYKNQLVYAVYDYDNACVDSRLHDLGEAIVAWAALEFANRSAQLTPMPRLLMNTDRAKIFYDAYTSIFPISLEEKDGLTTYIIAAWCEALLLGYVKGEISLSGLRNMSSIIDEVYRWCENA